MADECKLVGHVLVVDASKKEKQEKAPALFDLTNLQREANRKLGYTAQQTLDYTQSLYEKKLVSYPRTDSRYLTEDMEASLPGLITKVEKIANCEATEEKNIKAVINGKKVTDHHAIIPTVSVDKADLEELPSGEREVLKLIAIRLLEAVSIPCRYMETVIDADCNGHQFKAKGKQIIDSRAFFEAHREEITLHKAAKQAFSNLGVDKIPTIKQLNEEYGELLAQKKEAYKHYREAKQEMTDFATAKYDIERFLNLSQEESQHQEQEKEKQKKQNKSR